MACESSLHSKSIRVARASQPARPPAGRGPRSFYTSVCLAGVAARGADKTMQLQQRWSLHVYSLVISSASCLSGSVSSRLVRLGHVGEHGTRSDGQVGPPRNSTSSLYFSENPARIRRVIASEHVQRYRKLLSMIFLYIIYRQQHCRQLYSELLVNIRIQALGLAARTH